MRVRRLLTFFLLFISFFVSAQTGDNYRSTLSNPNIKIDSTNLPIVFINTEHTAIQRNSYILANMKIVNNGEGHMNYGDTIAHPNQTVNYEGYIALRYRGQASYREQDKKPFAFRTLKTNRLHKEGGEKKKVELLGMPKDSNWALLAPWNDRSMMRDVLTFELGRKWLDFVPKSRFCEIILDSTYYGVYILAEMVSKGKNRLDLHDMGADDGDLSGDILVYIDRDNAPYYQSRYHPWDGNTERTDCFIKYQYKSPDEDDFDTLPENAMEAIGAEIDKMEDSFMADDYTDPVTGYRSVVDVKSFIDYMLTTEFTCNIDGYRLSTYLYKYSDLRALKEGLDSKWKCSLWDYNIAYGNANTMNHLSYEIWDFDINTFPNFVRDKERVPFYWYKMLDDPLYVSQMTDRWREYRKGNYNTENVLQLVDSLATLLTSTGAVERNKSAWDIFNKIKNYQSPKTYSVDSYEEEITYLKNWIIGRLDFMDAHIEDVTTSISLNRLNAEKELPTIFSISGIKQNKLQKGLNIIRRLDGLARKVWH